MKLNSLFEERKVEDGQLKDWPKQHHDQFSQLFFSSERNTQFEESKLELNCQPKGHYKSHLKGYNRGHQKNHNHYKGHHQYHQKAQQKEVSLKLKGYTEGQLEEGQVKGVATQRPSRRRPAKELVEEAPAITEGPKKARKRANKSQVPESDAPIQTRGALGKRLRQYGYGLYTDERTGTVILNLGRS